MHIVRIPFIKADILPAKAISSPEKSTGKIKKRMKFQGLENDSRYTVALTALKVYDKKPKIRLWERAVLLRVVNSAGKEAGYVKVNASSLRKRFGITQEEFKAAKKIFGADLTLFISHKIEKKTQQKNKEKEKGFSSYTGALNAERKHHEGSRYGDNELECEGEYEGGFINGEYYGKGVVTYSDGSTYEGRFKNDKHAGRGTYKYAGNGHSEGYTYEGCFKDGKAHGKGTITYKSGDKFTGEFKEGNMDGKGESLYVNGIKLKGIFKEGKLVKGVMTSQKGIKTKIGPTSKNREKKPSFLEKMRSVFKK
ncbi:hypothetical protein [Parachlamydia sp. AcF125]|uniref:MORN repeat-containing protein n=1 Tax=Parachlamydia sp. AcF125 TaxID=2795736 RepID=UPI001BC8CF39|nr:hypothetical protein [Parachlamydia sp. AcF125]MBS4168787.1 hypothetical protein [Parachlamydia sp. AcF125]